MTLDDLSNDLLTAAWFEKLGMFTGQEGMVGIDSLDAWRTEEPVADTTTEWIAQSMEWLPSNPAEHDPIHGTKLKELAKSLGRGDELRHVGLDIYRTALGALSKALPNSRLRVGPHDFTQSAKGAAAYAARAAAGELVVGNPEFWCTLIPLYRQGFWPCGILPDRRIVVF